MTAAVRVVDLVKRYRQSSDNAVDGVSFEVAAGSFFSLLGPNGAGKTTIISILTTTLAPTTGTVEVAGHDVVRQSAAVRRSVGIIFQNPSLDLNLTAEENIRFHAVLYGLYPFSPAYRLMPREYRDKVTELSRVLGIEDAMAKPLRTFSGGMRRRLEIVRSLVHRPRVLFLDEPTSGLDAASRLRLWEYLRAMRLEEGTTVFLTTHYLEEAEDADNVAIINHGRLVAEGTPAQVKAELVDEYLEVDAGDRGALGAELETMQLSFEGSGPFRLPIGAAGAHQVLREIATPLSSVRTHSPTLEDAYLKVVGVEQE